MKYDTVIIGGGPAAVAAGVYAARKQMKTLFVADQIGGQSIVSDGIENWIGDTVISGVELAQKLKGHLDNYKEDVTIKVPARVISITKSNDGTFEVYIADEVFHTKTIVLATGGRHRTLDVPGESEYNGRGVAYCATCDAPFFRNKSVAVVGGGNSGLEAVVDLLPYADKIYLLARRDELRGDPITQQEVLASDKVEVLYRTNTQSISGEKMVTGLTYADGESGEKRVLDVQGVFVEVGSVPNSDIVEGIVELNDHKEVIIDHKTGVTNVPGVFAAGDVTDAVYKQNNVAVGDAIKAILSAYDYTKKN